jgi:hypothetical protein
MGADLYIRGIQASGAVSFDESKIYFRDSYNMGNVLWTLNLSWWRDVLPLLDEKQELKSQTLQRFRDQVASAKQHLPAADELGKHGARCSETGENSIQALHDHYIKKRRELLDFLDRAIENNSPIYCSL